MRNQSIDSKLLLTQNTINNAITIKEISTPLALIGYNQQRIKEGETLYTKATELQINQVK